jgi:hypothetical protein
MSSVKVKLKIADLVIAFKSEFPHQSFTRTQEKKLFAERFHNFIYKGKENPDILIEVKVLENLPEFEGAKRVFSVYHPADNSENWQLFRHKDMYIFKCPLNDRRQVMVVNNAFDRVSAYLAPREKNYMGWHITPIIYDFLQVLLINYFARRKSGIFMHAVGIRDLDGRGFIFAGKSGRGKTTTAKVWFRYSRAMILNDDRMIVRKKDDKFFIYGSPWHGTFSDYLASQMEEAPLSRIFLIRHADRNNLKRLDFSGAFGVLYPSLFPVFWSKALTNSIISFCLEMSKRVPCYSFGFKKDKSIVKFIRSS